MTPHESPAWQMDVTHVDAAELSSYGPFPKSAEGEVLSALLEDIEGESRGREGVLIDYRSAVTDEDRREQAEAVLKSVANVGAAASLARVIEVLYFAGRQGTLRKYSLKFPAYNILDEFFVGSIVPQGPRLLRRPRPTEGGWKLFGRSIDFPIGIPASVLTNNSEWVSYFFRQGYNVITTRTVRSRYRQANVAPNWVFVPSRTTPLSLDEEWGVVVADPSDWVDAGDPNVTTSNSFGVPSYDPENWQDDLRETLSNVEDGQILIVSVMGDAYMGEDHPADIRMEARATDFVLVAKLAAEAGADFIELNLSCPNSLREDAQGVQPPLCEDIVATSDVVHRVRAALPSNVKLIAKLSYLPEPDLRELLEECGRDLDGVAGINTFATKVVNRSGQPTFPGRERAGVSGIAIRNHGLEFVRRMARLRLILDLDLEILGMGGITDPTSFKAMYDAGANAVLSASGVFANPFLAQQCIRDFDGALRTARPILNDSDLEEVLMEKLEDLLPHGMKQAADGGPDRFDVAVRLAIPGADSLEALDVLLKKGAVAVNDAGVLLLP
jgi:dihydroorotate dehydrogenase